MAVSYAVTALDNFIREELPSAIHESLPALDPVYNQIKSSSLGVTRSKIGRGFEVEHLFATGVAGLIQHADPRGPAFLENQTYAQARVLNSSSSALAPFPSATGAPHTTSLKRELKLHMSTGNLSIPVTWMQGDALPASQRKQVAEDIRAVGKLRALQEAQSFFMASNNTLGRVDNYDNTNVASGYISLTIKAGTGRTSYFSVGMMVDILATSGDTPQWGTATDGSDVLNYTSSTAASYDPIIVTDVDYLSGVITLASVNATAMTTYGGASTEIADDDWIIARGCNDVYSGTTGREMKTWGLEDWMKSSGTLMGGSTANDSAVALDLSTYSQFKSQVVAVSGPLTDTRMNGYIGGYLDAYPGASLDTILTTMGVTLKYLEQPLLGNNRMMYERTNKALDVEGGWEDISYSFNGRKLKWLMSSFCLPGYLYGLQLMNGNIKRYVPPKVGGSDSRIGADLEFLAPITNGGTIFKIAHNSSGASQALLEAPFWQYCLIAPLDVKGVKLTGLTEATMN